MGLESNAKIDAFAGTSRSRTTLVSFVCNSEVFNARPSPPTSATLALKAGVPVKVVAQRFGHAKTDITNDIYAHALPSMQKDAAAKLSSLLR